MSVTTSFVEQCFESFDALRQSQADTPDLAIISARIAATTSSAAAAIRIMTNDQSGEVEEAEILALFGQVPDDLLEQIRAGDALGRGRGGRDQTASIATSCFRSNLTRMLDVASP